MNSVKQVVKQFKKTDTWVKYLLGFCVFSLLISIFWPRSGSGGVNLVPVPGTSYYRAVFEGFSPDDKINKALKENKPCFAAFVAPWCGHCKKLKPEWKKFEDGYKGTDCNVLSVDCTLHKELGKKHNVSGYPTIKYLPNGLDNTSDAVDYDGKRTLQGFSSFLDKYQKV